MTTAVLDEALELLEKANANLEPELLAAEAARDLMGRYVKAQRLIDFGIASLTRKVDNASEFARMTGTSVGKANAIVSTGKVLSSSPDLSTAFRTGAISIDQAAEIASAEESAPGAAAELVAVAQEHSFLVLKDKARKTKLEAEQHRDLALRQRLARSARSHRDEIGMVHIHLTLEPHMGTRLVNRAEAEANRLRREAKAAGREEPFERHLADGYAAVLSGTAKARPGRPELVVLVSHEVAKRGWTDVRGDEVCKIPGIGPVFPRVAKEIASDAFLNGVFYDGKDLRHFRRWSRHIPSEVAIALELGEPPDFDGVRCVDCGNHFRTEFDHVQPRAARGPTSNGNLKPRCNPCHQAKTKRDRRAGLLNPAET